MDKDELNDDIEAIAILAKETLQKHGIHEVLIYIDIGGEVIATGTIQKHSPLRSIHDLLLGVQLLRQFRLKIRRR